MPLVFDPDQPGDLLDDYELVECVPNDEEVPATGTCFTEVLELEDGSTVTSSYCSDEIFNPADYPILDPLLDILNTPPVPPVATTPPPNPIIPRPPPISPFDPPWDDTGGASSSAGNGDSVLPQYPNGILIIESDASDLGITGYEEPALIAGSIIE